MEDKGQKRSSYIGRAAEDTQRLLRDIIAENEKLQRVAAATQHENTLLHQQLNLAVGELQRHRVEQERLREQLGEIEKQSRSYSEQFAEIEQRNSNLASLYVSSYQLHGTLDRESVLNSLREIVINLIGSEEMAVFETNDSGSAMELVTSFGIDEKAWSRIDLAGHPIGRIVAAGEPWMIGQSPAVPELPGLVVCLPLKLDGRVTGAIVLFSLLPHKPGLQELDFELFDLLGTHAATALYCTRMHAQLAAGAAA